MNVDIPLKYLLAVLFGGGVLLIGLGIAAAGASTGLRAILERDEGARRLLLRSDGRGREVRLLLGRLSTLAVTLIGLGLGLMIEGGRRMATSGMPVDELLRRLF